MIMVTKKEIRVTIEEDLYESLKKHCEESNTTIKDVVTEAIKSYLSSPTKADLSELLSVKAKVIYVQHKTKCIICGSTIEINQRALWLKGIGCVCRKCLFEKALSKFTDKDYIKEITKLEIEIERLKAIKSELRKEIKRLAMLYTSIEIIDVVNRLTSLADQIDRALYENVTSGKDVSDTLKKISKQLDDLVSQLRGRELPKTWVHKILKELTRESGSETIHVPRAKRVRE